jgi:hypothetical protein
VRWIWTDLHWLADLYRSSHLQQDSDVRCDWHVHFTADLLLDWNVRGLADMRQSADLRFRHLRRQRDLLLVVHVSGQCHLPGRRYVPLHGVVRWSLHLRHQRHLRAQLNVPRSANVSWIDDMR